MMTQSTLWVAAVFLSAQQVGTISPGGMEAIGPKQDDPLAMCDPTTNPAGSPGGLRGIIVQGGREAIGPKQDDPRTPDATGNGGTPGVLAIGPKQDDPSRPGMLAIGPKQDDPSRPGTSARPGDDNDPKASGGSSGIVVQGGLEVARTGVPSRPGVLAIGPKQDDPSRPGALARPGDDNDPKAKLAACTPRG